MFYFSVLTWSNVACSIIVGSSGWWVGSRNEDGTVLAASVAFSIIGSVLAVCYIVVTLITTIKPLLFKKAKSASWKIVLSKNWKIVVTTAIKSVWGLASIGLNIAVSSKFFSAADYSELNDFVAELQKNATDLVGSQIQNSTIGHI